MFDRPGWAAGGGGGGRQDKANPLATILSAAMMFRYDLGRPEAAEALDHVLAPAQAQAPAHAQVTQVQANAAWAEAHAWEQVPSPLPHPVAVWEFHVRGSPHMHIIIDNS